MTVVSVHGEQTLEKFAETVGENFNSLQEYRKVARAYELSSRMDNLSFKHHQVLAAREDRQDWLAKAEAGGWSRREGIPNPGAGRDFPSTWSELREAPGRTPDRCGKSV